MVFQCFFLSTLGLGVFMCNGCVKISLGAKLRPVTSALFIYTKVVIYQGVCSCKLKCKSCRLGLNVEWMCCLLQYPYAKIICQKSVCKCFAVFLWAMWCVGAFPCCRSALSLPAFYVALRCPKMRLMQCWMLSMRLAVFDLR